MTSPQHHALHFIFDRFPCPEGARLIEVETPDGRSVSAGEWRQREDGLAELVVTSLDIPVLQPSASAQSREQVHEALSQELGMRPTLLAIAEYLGERGQKDDVAWGLYSRLVAALHSSLRNQPEHAA